MIALVICWFIVGMVKLRYFDWNNEGNWLIMMGDRRNMRISTTWALLFLFITWATWPVGLVFRKFSICERIFKFQFHYL